MSGFYLAVVVCMGGVIAMLCVAQGGVSLLVWLERRAEVKALDREWQDLLAATEVDR